MAGISGHISCEGSAAIPRRCRWFGHAFHKTGTDRGCDCFHWTVVETCWCCPAERRLEYFDSRGYWCDFSRRIEDRRLEDVIRRATR